jgi:cytochrome c biogenesis protein CcmG/thiol:disulfide interchange protein DsbE
MLTRALYILPVIGLFALAAFFFVSLNGPPPDQLPSVLIDKPAPEVSLPALDANAHAFSSADLKAGHVSIVNVWASWCVPCRAEAPELQALAQRRDVALYGIVYKDAPDKARAFLNDVGNPFSRIDLDASGSAGIEWGIYGVPETFIIDGNGIVRLRYPGPIVGNTLTDTILPAIAQARAER